MVPIDEKERRAFVRETATNLAAAASITLNRENAMGLADFCRVLREDAARLGIAPIASLAGACEELCGAAGESVAPSVTRQMDQLLKECLAVIQSSLFKLALGGPAQMPEAQLTGLVAKIRALVGAGGTPAVPAEERAADVEAEPEEAPAAVERGEPAAPEPGGGGDWEELERLIASSFRGTARRPEETAPSTAADRLLRGMSRLAARLEQEPRYRDEAFEVAGAAHEAHSVGIERVCFDLAGESGGVRIETPESRIEESRAAVARACLERWMKEASPVTGASVSIRLVGPQYWVELRVPSPSRGPSPVRAAGTARESAPVAGTAAMEHYSLPDGTRVWRAAVPASLPAFEAHRIHAGRRTFLVPACDVHGMSNRIPAGMDKVTIEHLLELPEEDEPPRGQRIPVLISCRGKVIAVEADAVSGKETFLARAVEDAGAGNRGIAGIARTADGARAVVLDLVPWIEVHEARGATGPTVEAADDPRPASGYVVFKASGKRYAVPLKSVLGVGSLEPDAWLMGVVETKRGVFHLRDVKASLGLEGAAGGVYVVVQGSRGAVAWAVDGIERLAVQDIEGVRPLAPLGQTARAALFRGILIPSGRVPGGAHGVPIYLLSPDALVGEPGAGRRAA